LKYSNYDILKCIKIIFSVNSITKNYGSIIVIILFCFYLGCFIMFIIKGINPLKIKLMNELKKIKEKNKSEFNVNSSDLLCPPIRKKTLHKLILRADLEKRNQLRQQKRLSFNISNNIKNKIDIYPNSDSRRKALYKYPTRKDIIIYNKKETENIQGKEYSDYELNELEYLEAIKYDKRSFCQMYWATLKREHLIIFTFLNYNDYNLFIIKLSRFIFLFVGDMALNVFFFSDDSMHKLFLNYGKYDFFQQIPQIVYSTIFSQIIEVFLCFLSLTDKYIYELKSNFIEGKKDNNKKTIKVMNIKLIIFFIFTFIFFFLYWYLISVFCSVYRNTQKHFIKDSLISFSLGLLYPFAFYFISSSLRICAISDKGKKRFECIYKFSYIIPLF